MNRSYNVLAVSVTAALLSLSAQASTGQAISAPPAEDRFIVTFEPGERGAADALVRAVGGNIKLTGKDFLAAKFDGMTLPQVKNRLAKGKIKGVEVDQPRQAFALYNDDTTNPHTAQTRSYAITQSQADLVAMNYGSSRKVCVIDSGLDGMHPDFDFSTIQGSDDAGTGQWDVEGGPHGTHVAGIIAASDNATGTLGVAPGVNLHIVKVFTENGWAYSSDLAHAAQQCINAGAHVINMSLGGGSPSSVEASVFDTFLSNGGLSIAAAGNGGTSALMYPAGYSSVMMVGANDANNQIAAFSQFPTCKTGKGRNASADEGTCVEVAAAGVRVMSAYPVVDGTYGYMSGTSMATPVVAGAAAKVWSHFPTCSGEEIRTALRNSAEDAGAAGKDPYFGYGIVKIGAAYNYLQTNGCGTQTTEPTPEPEPTPCKGGSRKCG